MNARMAAMVATTDGGAAPEPPKGNGGMARAPEATKGNGDMARAHEG
jgi:hypothetical protein